MKRFSLRRRDSSKFLQQKEHNEKKRVRPAAQPSSGTVDPNDTTKQQPCDYFHAPFMTFKI